MSCYCYGCIWHLAVLAYAVRLSASAPCPMLQVMLMHLAVLYAHDSAELQQDQVL